jgi:uncharacterized membrane protein
MSWYLIIKLLHVLAAIILVGGLIARQIVRSVAERAQDVHTFALQSEAAGRIEQLMVIPGSMAVLIIGVILALISGQPIFGSLQGSGRNWLLVANLLLVLTLLLVPLVFVPRGKKFEAILADALNRDQFTQELRAAQLDPVVRFGHTFEIVGIILIVFLMVVKPF